MEDEADREAHGLGDADDGGPRVLTPDEASVAPTSQPRSTSEIFGFDSWLSSTVGSDRPKRDDINLWTAPGGPIRATEPDVLDRAHLKFVAIDNDSHQPMTEDGDRVHPGVVLGRFYDTTTGQPYESFSVLSAAIRRGCESVASEASARRNKDYEDDRRKKDARAAIGLKSAKGTVDESAKRAQWSGNPVATEEFLNFVLCAQDGVDTALKEVSDPSRNGDIWAHAWELLASRVKKYDLS